MIVGGGLAGLAAASGLVDRGLRITHPGEPAAAGRPRQLVPRPGDRRAGRQLPARQHGLLHQPGRFLPAGRDRRRCSAASRSWSSSAPRARSRGSAPASGRPRSTWPAVSWRRSFLKLRDKLRVAYGLACLAWDRDDRPGESFADWLLRHRQTLRAINLFWGAGAGLGPERAARPDGRRPRAQGLPRRLPPQPDGVPARAAPGPAGRALRHAAGELAARSTRSRSGSRPGSARSSRIEDGAIGGVVLRSGESIAADFVVLAVPFDRVGGPDPRRPARPDCRRWPSSARCRPRRSPASTSGSTGRSARSTTSSPRAG